MEVHGSVHVFIRHDVICFARTFCSLVISSSWSVFALPERSCVDVSNCIIFAYALITAELDWTLLMGITIG